LNRAYDINDDGQIVGVGAIDGQTRAFLLTHVVAEKKRSEGNGQDENETNKKSGDSRDQPPQIDMYVDDDYNAGTPGWGIDHFKRYKML